MKKIISVLALTLLVNVAHAAAPTVENAERLKFPEPLDNMRPLAEEAIKTGEAHGVLGGDTARFIERQTGATTPLHVNVTILIKYKQPGCARLNAQFLQKDVVMPGESKPQNKEIDFQFNYCLDGKPPRTEGMEYVINNPFAQPVQIPSNLK